MSKKEEESFEDVANGCISLIVLIVIVYFVFFRGCGNNDNNTSTEENIEWLNVKKTSNKVLTSEKTLNFTDFQEANGEQVSIKLSTNNERLIGFSIKENGVINHYSKNNYTEFDFNKKKYDKETYSFYSSNMTNKNDTSIRYIANLVMEETGNIGLNSSGQLTGTLTNCVLFVRSENYIKAFNFDYALNNLEEVFPDKKKNNNSVNLKIFKDVDKVINQLNKVGIGQLGKWKFFDFDWSAITPYYTFGSGSMQNNLAYYLSSEDEEYIRKLKLVLNINNKSEKQQALKMFKKIGEETLRKLNIEIPNNLWDNLNVKKDFSISEENYSLSVIFEESNIDTWKLVIESK